MSSFGSIGFGTLEPGNGSLEEQISWTGVTQNSNGTATLTGVSSVTFAYPYTKTSGLMKTHAGSTIFVVSNTSGYYDQFVAKDDDGTISQTLTFSTSSYPQMSDSTNFPTLNQQLATKGYADSLSFAGAPNATTTQKGIVQLPTQAQVDARTTTGSTGASLAVIPTTLRSTLLSDYVIDTGSTNTILIAPSPVISAYTAGQQFSTKVATTNTSTVTVNVNGLGGKNLYKLNGTTSLVANDIVSGEIISIEYDGTNFQLISPSAKPKISQDGAEVYSSDTGSANAYVVTLVPAITSYTTGADVSFSATNANTGASTVNVNGLGTKNIFKNGSLPLVAGDIKSGQIVVLVYDGTQFQMQNPSGNAINAQSDFTTSSVSVTSGVETVIKTFTLPSAGTSSHYKIYSDGVNGTGASNSSFRVYLGNTNILTCATSSVVEQGFEIDVQMLNSTSTEAIVAKSYSGTGFLTVTNATYSINLSSNPTISIKMLQTTGGAVTYSVNYTTYEKIN